MCRSKAQGGRRCPNRGGGQRIEVLRDLETPVPSPEPTSTKESLNPNTPNYNKLLSTPTGEWLSTPWKERKLIAEQALHEVIKLTGSVAVFIGWSRSTASLGKAYYQRNIFTDEPRRGIELSDPNGRFSEPITIADTIAHEVAHTLTSPEVDHGKEWVDEFESVKNKLNLTTELKYTHTLTEAEMEQRKKDYEEKKRNALWIGSCPQGHTFAAGRKPKYGYKCVPCNQDGKPADITYERNPNRGGKK